MKPRLNEDIVFQVQCKKCGFNHRVPALQREISEKIYQTPVLTVCPFCKTFLDTKMVEDLTTKVN